MEERLYFAYGSNINLKQMKHRCPNAKVVGPVTLDGYRLTFRGSGVATILPCEGRKVEGLLWKLTPACEQALDYYEGYPHLYHKEDIVVRDKENGEITTMVYVMDSKYEKQPSLPREGYFKGIYDGYMQNKIETDSLFGALKETWAEVVQMKKARQKGKER